MPRASKQRNRQARTRPSGIIAWGGLLLVFFLHTGSCQEHVQETRQTAAPIISLAEWSLHRNIQQGKIGHLDFPRIAADSFGLHHIEYVSQFFQDKANDRAYLDRMKDSCEKYGVGNLLIMIDGEGNLGNLDPARRKQAVENHKKWIQAAQYLNCQAIRVNGNGLGDTAQVKAAVVQSLRTLSQWGEEAGIRILVENHGMAMPDGSWNPAAPSTNGKWLAEVLKKVNSNYCGALPDFGNFHNYNRYQGVKDLMPYAFGISAKIYNFDANGEAVQTDFARMFKLMKQYKFDGAIGIEYEGPASNGLTEYQGVGKTLRLIRKHLNEKTSPQN